MKTEYKILWLEDNRETIETDIDDIDEFLENYGVKPEFTIEDPSPESGWQDRLEDSGLDLILVDFNMGPGRAKGSELIKTIRGNSSPSVFLPVVFYSQTLEVVRSALTESQLEGTFLTNRGELKEKIINILKMMLVRDNTIKQARGLLMEEIAEIDILCVTLARLIFGRLSPKDQCEFLNYSLKNLEESSKKNWLDIKKLPSNANLLDMLGKPPFFTMNRFKAVLKGLRLDNQIQNEMLEIFKDLNHGDFPLIKNRNDYAHMTRSELQERLRGIEEEEFVRIRKEIRRQVKNLNSLIELSS